jgi:hypothetical protein
MEVVYCAACAHGDHAHHTLVISVAPPGAFGSAQCPCEGECQRVSPANPDVQILPTLSNGPVEYTMADGTVMIRKDHYDLAIAQRDAWIRLFNRLEHQITFHERAPRFKDDHDERLYDNHARILTAATREVPRGPAR